MGRFRKWKFPENRLDFAGSGRGKGVAPVRFGYSQPFKKALIFWISFADMTRCWCTLEGGFLTYYESERSLVAMGRVDVGEVVSLAVNNTETVTGAG